MRVDKSRRLMRFACDAFLVRTPIVLPVHLSPFPDLFAPPPPQISVIASSLARCTLALWALLRSEVQAATPRRRGTRECRIEANMILIQVGYDAGACFYL